MFTFQNSDLDPPDLADVKVTHLDSGAYIAKFDLTLAIRVAGQNLDPWFVLVLAFITFALTTFTNVFLMLLTRTLTTNENVIERVWNLRFVIDVAIAIAAVLGTALAQSSVRRGIRELSRAVDRFPAVEVVSTSGGRFSASEAPKLTPRDGIESVRGGQLGAYRDHRHQGGGNMVGGDCRRTSLLETHQYHA